MPEEASVPEVSLTMRKKNYVPLIIGIGLLATAGVVGFYFLWPMIFKKKPYECMYCSASFDTQNELCYHIDMDHPDKELPSQCVPSDGGNGGDLTPDPFSASISTTLSTLQMPLKIVGGVIGCGGSYDLATGFTMVLRDMIGNPCPNKTVDIVGSPSSIAAFNVKYTKHCADWWAGGCWASCYHSVNSGYNSGTSTNPWRVISDSNGIIKGNIGVITYPSAATSFMMTVYYGGLSIGTIGISIVPSVI